MVLQGAETPPADNSYRVRRVLAFQEFNSRRSADMLQNAYEKAVKGDVEALVSVCESAHARTGANAMSPLCDRVLPNGDTPLIFCIKRALPDLVERLLFAGADVNAAPPGRPPPVYACVCALDIRVLQVLLAAPALDVNARTLARCKTGERIQITPCMYAASMGYALAIRMLCERAECDVNAQNENGWNALTFAAASLCTDAVAALFARGAATDVRDAYGMVPYDWAKMAVDARAAAGRFVRADCIDMLETLRVDRRATETYALPTGPARPFLLSIEQWGPGTTMEESDAEEGRRKSPPKPQPRSPAKWRLHNAARSPRSTKCEHCHAAHAELRCSTCSKDYCGGCALDLHKAIDEDISSGVRRYHTLHPLAGARHILRHSHDLGEHTTRPHPSFEQLETVQALLLRQSALSLGTSRDEPAPVMDDKRARKLAEDVVRGGVRKHEALKDFRKTAELGWLPGCLAFTATPRVSPESSRIGGASPGSEQWQRSFSTSLITPANRASSVTDADEHIPAPPPTRAGPSTSPGSELGQEGSQALSGSDAEVGAHDLVPGDGSTAPTVHRRARRRSSLAMVHESVAAAAAAGAATLAVQRRRLSMAAVEALQDDSMRAAAAGAAAVAATRVAVRARRRSQVMEHAGLKDHHVADGSPPSRSSTAGAHSGQTAVESPPHPPRQPELGAEADESQRAVAQRQLSSDAAEVAGAVVVVMKPKAGGAASVATATRAVAGRRQRRRSILAGTAVESGDGAMTTEDARAFVAESLGADGSGPRRRASVGVGGLDAEVDDLYVAQLHGIQQHLDVGDVDAASVMVHGILDSIEPTKAPATYIYAAQVALHIYYTRKERHAAHTLLTQIHEVTRYVHNPLAGVAVASLQALVNFYCSTYLRPILPDAEAHDHASLEDEASLNATAKRAVEEHLQLCDTLKHSLSRSWSSRLWTAWHVVMLRLRTLLADVNGDAWSTAVQLDEAQLARTDGEHGLSASLSLQPADAADSTTEVVVQSPPASPDARVDGTTASGHDEWAAAIKIQRIWRGRFVRKQLYAWYNIMWAPRMDPDTGARYFVNLTTGESRWTLPEFMQAHAIVNKLWCPRCSAALAEWYSVRTRDASCTGCLGLTNNEVAGSSWVPIEPQDACCEECDADIGAWFCAECAQWYCSQCWLRGHAKGARRDHHRTPSRKFGVVPESRSGNRSRTSSAVVMSP